MRNEPASANDSSTAAVGRRGRDDVITAVRQAYSCMQRASAMPGSASFPRLLLPRSRGVPAAL
jgi:hypothetical protein